MSQWSVELHLQVGQTVSLLESLGFIINREKSQLVAILSADPFPGFLSGLSDYEVISSQRKDPADCLDVSELSDSTGSIPQESLSTAGKDVCHNYWFHSGIRTCSSWRSRRSDGHCCIADREYRLVQTATWKSLPECEPEARIIPSVPFCFSPEQPTGSVHEFVTWPICYHNWCTSDQVDGSGGVCPFSSCPDSAVSSKNQDREVYSAANSPMLKDAPFIPSSAGSVSGIFYSSKRTYLETPTTSHTLKNLFS